MNGLGSLIACMIICLVAACSLFLAARDRRTTDLRGHYPAPDDHPLMADRIDGRFHCTKCAQRGGSVSFDNAGSLIVHEFEDHTIGRL